MAKFYGPIGYVTTEESPPGSGVWIPVAKEYNYSGDILRANKRTEPGVAANDNINISNRFSIVASAFAFENVFAMSYILWRGTRWKITSVEEERPRLILTIGGVYNGPTPEPTEASTNNLP